MTNASLYEPTSVTELRDRQHGNVASINRGTIVDRASVGIVRI